MFMLACLDCGTEEPEPVTDDEVDEALEDFICRECDCMDAEVVER